MLLTRRNFVATAGVMSSLSVAAATAPAAAADDVPRLPDKAAFAPTDGVYLDSGSQHPMSLGAIAAANRYFAHKTFGPGSDRFNLDQEGVRAKFAKLVNAASADQIAFVQSTTTGEQIVLRGLGLPQAGAHIVTDTLHFFGSLPIYEEMARQGCEVTWVRARDGRIALDDMRAAIRKDTRLVALSLVSTINGFEHDLKAVCDIAHANGAMVYADIIHAAGCVPVDVQASGVDFTSCASYKWLMGDFGLGFLYGRKESMAKLRRTEYGYEGLSKFEPHVYPFDPPGNSIVDYAYTDSAEGQFAHATIAFSVIAQLGHSLDYIEKIGVANIQAYVQTLVDQLKQELPRLGYTMMTPPETRAPLVACAMENARERLRDRMASAKITITTSKNRFRLSPSVFNDHADIEKFLSALGHA